MGYVTDNFSKRLKTIRETAGLTQEQLAKELKVSRGAISYYEKGDRTPDIEFLDSVSMFFDLPFEYLLGYTNNIKEEHRNMYEFYGLTDEACTELEDNDTLGHIFSQIVTNPSFFGFRHLINNVIENYRDFDHTSIGYLSFILSDELQKLIAAALRAELNAQYTDEDKKEIYKTINELFAQHDKFQEKFDKEEVAFKKRSKKRMEEDMETMKNSVEYIARSKVHEAIMDATLFLDDIEE